MRGFTVGVVLSLFMLFGRSVGYISSRPQDVIPAQLWNVSEYARVRMVELNTRWLQTTRDAVREMRRFAVQGEYGVWWWANVDHAVLNELVELGFTVLQPDGDEGSDSRVFVCWHKDTKKCYDEKQ